MNSFRTLLLALVLSIGVSYVYAAWSPPSTMPTGGNAEAPVNVGGSTQVKSGALSVNGLLTAVSNLVVNGSIQTPTLCLSGDCKSAWPAGFSGTIDWSSITNRPSGLDDGDDIGAVVTKSPAVYECPNQPSSCQGTAGDCNGQLSRNSNCTVRTPSGGASCAVGTRVCSFVGYLAQ